MIIHRSDKMPDKHHMIGTNRFAEECHLSFIQSSVPFSVVAGNTRCHQVFPGILTALRLWDDMVHSEHGIGSSAILTAVSITA